MAVNYQSNLYANLSPEEGISLPPEERIEEAMSRMGVTPLCRISRSSLTEIWQVRDIVNHAPFLWKHLLPLWEHHSEIVRRFQVDAEIGRRVRGESILEFCAVSDSRLLPAQLHTGFSGIPLDQLLKQHQILTPEMTIWLARQIVDGLCSLAMIGFIHGDLRPEYLLVDHQGRLRLTGFYTAQPLHFDRFLPAEGLERELFCAPWYQPPELNEQGIPAHPSQDLYQLGIILYQCLTGTLPFDGADRTEIERAHRCSTPRRIRALAPHVPRDLRDLVESLIFKSPLRRPQSLREVREELISLELRTLRLAASA